VSDWQFVCGATGSVAFVAYVIWWWLCRDTHESAREALFGVSLALVMVANFPSWVALVSAFSLGVHVMLMLRSAAKKAWKHLAERERRNAEFWENQSNAWRLTAFRLVQLHPEDEAQLRAEAKRRGVNLQWPPRPYEMPRSP
jgi:hypothetical protein